MVETNNNIWLEYATMEEILEEVGKRHSAAVILYTSGSTTNTEVGFYANMAYRGSMMEAIGLVTYAQYTFLREEVIDE